METALIVLRPHTEPRTKELGQGVRTEFLGGAEEVRKDTLQGMSLELASCRGQFWDGNNEPSSQTLQILFPSAFSMISFPSHRTLRNSPCPITWWQGMEVCAVSCDELGHLGPKGRHPLTYTAAESQPLQPGCLAYIWMGMEKRAIYNYWRFHRDQKDT